MPSINEALFILVTVIIFTFVLFSLYLLINKANNRRRELKDLEQRLHMQEQLHLYYLAEHSRLDIMEPVIVKEGHVVKQQEKPLHGKSPLPPLPHEKPILQGGKHDSILKKVYGYRDASSSPPIPPPQQVTRPSAARPPSFLPMKDRPRSFISETKGILPPAYTDYATSIPISDEKNSDR
ncbi:hypothetical protein K501DRAFT_337332 [Backusella circina FSU 941]|nr:hypothetical protein K501DRAFT_337332 [Backusella circina FSU 941]